MNIVYLWEKQEEKNGWKKSPGEAIVINGKMN